MTDKIKSFRDLKVWQKGIELVKEIYIVTNTFPKEELYVLSSQMRRAAISVPSNVAEGFRRKHNKEQIQFLNVAMGSIAELETQVVLAQELQYIGLDKEAYLVEIMSHISGMLINLIKKIDSN